MAKSEHAPPQDLIGRWAPLAFMVLAAVLVYATGANRYVSLHELRLRQGMLQAFVAEHYMLSLLAYVAVFSIATAVAVPGAVFLQLAAGLLFGTAVGGSLTAFGATLGAVAMYYATRSAFGDALRAKAAKADGVAARWREGLERHAFWYLLSLRIPPVMPFVIISLVAGFAAVPVRAYTAATLLGVWPSALVYASIGAGLSRAFERDAAVSLWDPAIFLPLMGLSVLSLIPAAVGLVRRKTATA